MATASRILAICAAVMAFSANAETPLTLMSFNVRFGTANDGDNHWDKRKDLLVQAVSTHVPDLMGTQECLDFQAKYIADKLPQYAWFGIGREKDATGEMTAIFYKKDALVLKDSGYYWLSETPEVPGSKSWDTACTRLVSWAKFEHKKTGRPFYYANTHFDHVSDLARVNSAKLMTSRLPSDGQTVLVTGDFNAIAETSTCWQTFNDCGFTDAWLAAEHKVGPEVTFNGFKELKPDGKKRIDWVLFKGGVKVRRIETSLFSEQNRYPSDHFPVVAQLVLE